MTHENFGEDKKNAEEAEAAAVAAAVIVYWTLLPIHVMNLFNIYFCSPSDRCEYTDIEHGSKIKQTVWFDQPDMYCIQYFISARNHWVCNTWSEKKHWNEINNNKKRYGVTSDHVRHDRITTIIMYSVHADDNHCTRELCRKCPVHAQIYRVYTVHIFTDRWL